MNPKEAEHKYVEKELSLLMETTLRLENELHSLVRSEE